MGKRIRLQPEKRKAEIRKRATALFRQKGYAETTMADLVEASGLSFGGFYHHYSDKAEILLDIMKDGNRYREEESLRFVEAHPELAPGVRVVELGLNKLLDPHERKDLYAMLLLEMKNDEKLRAHYQTLREEGLAGFSRFFRDADPTNFENLRSEFFMGVVNCLFLGMYVLDLQDVFAQEKDLLREMLTLMMNRKNKEG